MKKEDASVEIEVFDEDFVMKDDYIGHITIPLKSLKDGKLHEQWYPLYPQASKKVISGDVHCKICYENPKLKIDGTLAFQ